MGPYLDQLQSATASITGNIPFALAIIGLLWGILLLNKLLGYRLNYLGIYPRHLLGLPGIICHPFLHGSFNHLFFNTFPLFALLVLLLTSGMGTFVCVTLSVVLISGASIWLLGRKGLHVGASALIMGYLGYLLVNAYRHPSLLALLLAVVCLYYFGSLLLSIFPSEDRVSWEGHLFGLAAGIISAVIC